jgi:transcriptional regulator with XRE-family HTH domain
MSPREQADPSLGVALRELRTARALTQETTAQLAGITTGTLSRIESGRENPSWSTVSRLAAALEVSLGELGRTVDRILRDVRINDGG